MFTYDDFLKIWAYLHEGDADNLDTNTLKLAISEQTKSKTFIENTVDQTAFMTDDYKRIKNFIIDWYASHRTLITTQKNASDLYSIPEDHLNELFYCFGFDIGDSLKNLSYESKIVFFYDLVNLYKVKGTPESLFKILNYFNIPSVEICEYWLQKNSNNELVLNGRPVFASPGLITYGESEVPYAATLADPHWMTTEDQVEYSLANQKIRLPSKTPYYGIRPTYFVNNINVLESYIERKIQDDYNTYVTTGVNTRDIRCSMGLDVSFLELYLGMIYLFKRFYNPYGHNNDNFLCYAGSTLPSYDEVLEIYNTITTKPKTRDEIKAKKTLLYSTFRRPVATNFLYGSSDTGNTLNMVHPEFKTEIDYYILVGKELNGMSLLFQDFSSWLRNNIGVDESAFPSFILDFSTYSLWYLDQAIRFFKPYRARLLLVEKVYNIGNSVEDLIIPDDKHTTDTPLDIKEFTYDYDTADSSPSFYNDSTAENYYSREHFDAGSYFDLGASTDEEPSIDMSDTFDDVLNSHPNIDSTAFVHTQYTLDSTGEISITWQEGGFVDFDGGWYYDMPFMSDRCHITVIDESSPGG